MQTNMKSHLRKITATAVFTALYIVLDRYLAIVPSTANTNIKITFAVAVLMLCGYFLGPVAGGVCGVLADILGGILAGIPIYLPLTLKPVLLGVIPGLVAWLYEKKKLPFDPYHPVAIALTVVFSELLASGLWATLALSWLMGTSFGTQFVMRVPVIVLSIAVDAVLLVMLISSETIRKAAKKYLS